MARKNKFPEIEQELKIKLPLKDLEKVFRVLSRGKKIEHKYTPRLYYDTADLQLYRRGISLRVQYKPGRDGRLGGHAQTLKFSQGAAAMKGALLRKECQDALHDATPDLGKVSDREAKALIKPFKKKKWRHIFTAEMERRFFMLKGGKGLAEIAFDVGQIVLPHNGCRFPFAEIEIELKEGPGQVIADLYKKIKKIAPSARIQPMSKSDQGSLLYLRARPGRADLKSRQARP